MLIARPRAGYSSNHNRSDCSDFSHRLPPFNRFETKLQIELKTFIVALPSGDGNSRAEFDWNLAGEERERENLQGYACSSNSRIEFSRCFRSFTVIVCHELSLEMVTLDFALWPGPMLQAKFSARCRFPFRTLIPSTSRGFLGIRSIYTSSCIVLGLICLRCLKFGWKKLFIIVQIGGYLQIV